MCFKDLHKPHGDCSELTRQVTGALHEHQHLRKLFVLANKYDLEARLEAVTHRWDLSGNRTDIARKVLAYFPHIWAPSLGK
ncbi:hypothetical protein FRB95_004586, partial [Tulasnella sp. JGI-2019a]